MRGAILPLPQYAFMAWCSVKKSTGTALPLGYCSFFIHALEQTNRSILITSPFVLQKFLVSLDEGIDSLLRNVKFYTAQMSN
jgi:hypothetical protein